MVARTGDIGNPFVTGRWPYAGAMPVLATKVRVPSDDGGSCRGTDSSTGCASPGNTARGSC